jgi:hypothetical protein
MGVAESTRTRRSPHGERAITPFGERSPFSEASAARKLRDADRPVKSDSTLAGGLELLHDLQRRRRESTPA